MHTKFHQQIDSKVSVLCNTPAVGGKNGPQVPNLPKDGRNQDTEEFERWLNGFLQWLKVNKICGSESDSDQIEFTTMFLEGNTLSWLEDNVDGAYHQCMHWTFKDVITGLYDQFTHNNLMHDASDKFSKVEYNAEDSVLSYYYKLEWYTNRMIEPPDSFTFWSQLVTRLPVNIIAFILDKGCTAETASMEEILYFAKEAEDIKRMTKHFKEKKCTMDSTKSKGPSPLIKPKDPTTDRSYDWSRDHNRTRYHDYHRSSHSRPHDKEP